MKKRTLDEMISYFNQQVAEMEIPRENKMQLLGMVTALGYRQNGKWVWNDEVRRVCSLCGNEVAFILEKDGWHEGRFCPNCGARMEEG